MSQYLKLFPDATPEEKSALRSWVRSGHSPYENGDFIATDSGGPMDFINARRFQEELYQEYLKNPDAFCDEPNSGEWGLFDTNLNSNIPF